MPLAVDIGAGTSNRSVTPENGKEDIETVEFGLITPPEIESPGKAVTLEFAIDSLSRERQDAGIEIVTSRSLAALPKPII